MLVVFENWTVYGSKVDTLQVTYFDGLDIDQSVVMPESDFSQVLGSGSDFEGQGLVMGYAVDLKEEVIE